MIHDCGCVIGNCDCTPEEVAERVRLAGVRGAKSKQRNTRRKQRLALICANCGHPFSEHRKVRVPAEVSQEGRKCGNGEYKIRGGPCRKELSCLVFRYPDRRPPTHWSTVVSHLTDQGGE